MEIKYDSIRGAIVDTKNEIKVTQPEFLFWSATHPEKVSFLSLEWDTTLTDIWRIAKRLVQERPNGVGQLHFNGGGRSKNSWFENNSYLKKEVYNPSFGLANHFVNLPWTWAKYMVESKVTNGYPSFAVELIEHPVYAKPN